MVLTQAERSKRWREKNKDRVREKDRHFDIKRTYGITINEYNEMFRNQNGMCKICGSTDFHGKTRLAIDHCHLTNKIRGLLCTKCNAGLGMFTDDIEKLAAAISYLKEYS